MPTLSVTKTYANNQILFEADLDGIRTSIQTFVNSTLLDSDNVQCDSLASSFTSTGSNAILQQVTSIGSAAAIPAIAEFASAGYIYQADSTGAITLPAPLTATSLEFNLSGGGATTFTTITDAQVSITARNRPIMILVQSTSTSSITAEGAFGTNSEVSLKLTETVGMTDLESQTFNGARLGTDLQYFPASSFLFFDLNPGAGSKTYSLAYRNVSHVGKTLEISKCILKAVEI